MQRVLEKVSEALLGAVLLAALGSLAGCGSKDSLIVVTVSTVANSSATNLHTLVLSAGGTSDTFHITGQDITAQDVKVGLYVPSSLTGPNIKVTAQASASSAACYAGSTTVAISAAGSTVNANITMNYEPTCTGVGGTGGSSGTGGTGAKGGTTGTGGVGAKGGSGGTGGTGGTGGSTGTAGAPDLSRCSEIDHGATGSCASCTFGSTADVSVYGVAFSPNGATVVTGGTDGRVKIWTNTAGTLVAQGTPLAGTGLGCVAFSPDGSLLAIGRIGGVDIVSTSTWTVIRTLQTATAQEAYAVGFSPDGANVFTVTAPSGGGVTGVLFAHAVGNTQALTIQSLTTAPWGMGVAPNIVAGAVPVAVTDTNGDASIYSWTSSGFGTPVVLKVTSDASTAEAAAFSPGSTVFASGGDDGILSLWNYPAAAGSLPDGQVNVYTVTGTASDYVGAVAFSPTYGYFVVGGSFNGTLTGYTLTDGSMVGVQYNTQYDMLSVAYSPSSNVIVGGELDCGCVVVCPQ